MKITICGAGLLGITSAYVLASRGHEVEVIERHGEPAMETSFANGGQLSYSHAEPWANPAVFAKLPKWLLHEDSPLIFRPRADIDMIAWGMKFLYYCNQASARKHCVEMLRLGLYSRRKMAELRKDTKIAFDFSDAGILHIFGTDRDLEQAIKQVEFQARYGGEERVLDIKQALTLEPALSHAHQPMSGAIHAHRDESGNPKKFCDALAAYMQEHMGVVFHYHTDITKFAEQAGRITGVETSRGTFTADAYVVALSSYSPLMMGRLGIRLPIYPMKGYSVSVPINDYAPNLSITDGSHKIVYSRLGDVLRVAGTAEFAGYNTDILDSRIRPIVRAAKTLFPYMDWEHPVSSWACLRPSTPSGLPCIGATRIKNLYLNTGHGTLGWTQAAGSSHKLADIMENRTPEV